MKYGNLFWAITNWGSHYKFAQHIGISESRLSRCLWGRTQFNAAERLAIAKALSYQEDWLFEEIVPPVKA